jgi:phosphoribosylanthranilate isomerase
MAQFLPRPVIKAFHIPVEKGCNTQEDQARFLEGFRKTLSLINQPGLHAFSILDSSNLSQCGGTGQAFDWEAVQSALASSAYPANNLVIAGGLNIHNLPACIQTFRPFIIDICSGVELDHQTPAENKDLQKISNALLLIKSHP